MIDCRHRINRQMAEANLYGELKLLSHTKLSWLGYIKIYCNLKTAARGNLDTGSGVGGLYLLN